MSTNGESSQNAETPANKVNWDDPNVLAGDSPPLPVWPLILSATVWLGCVATLAVTAFRS